MYMRSRLSSSVPGVICTLAVAAFGLLPVAASSQPDATKLGTTSEASSAACPALLQMSFERLQDEKPQPLCQYAGKVLLVVNTASFCGFTRQYRGLEDLYARYKDKGLVVLGFPSNDFSQESGSNKEVAEFCENTFGVKFPMFVKSSVRGPHANALFKELAAQTGTAPGWNFYKYLVGRDGKVIAAFPSRTEPQDREFIRLVEKQLASTPG